MSEKKRFQDNSAGFITDTKYKKHWLPKDSWGDLGQWRTFEEARRYAHTMNQVYAGGFSDWRLPTLEEARNLYDQELGQKDWDDEAVFIDSLFVTKCANFMWTSETNDKQEVCRINLRNGEVEFIDRNTRDHQSVRLVRDTGAAAGGSKQ